MIPVALAAMVAFTGGPQLRQVQDPRIPMPNPWRDPGYLKFYWIESPHKNARPNIIGVDTVVVHHTVTPTLEATTRWFLNPEAKVSAHFTIGRDGSIVQHLSTFERAWHAGVSKDPAGRPNVNDYSIGIELVNLGDGKDPWPDAQVNACAFLIATLKGRFPIKQILSHEYVAQPPGRKNDPRNFPWKKLEWIGLPMYYGQNKG